jgi:hypothetical protein
MLGFGSIGEHHFSLFPDSGGRLNALELRWRRQILERIEMGAVYFGAGGGADIIWLDIFRRYYGYRVIAQSGILLQSKIGLGLSLPFSLNYTDLRVKNGRGLSFTPGISVGYDDDCFSVRVGYNYPLGGFFQPEVVQGDTLVFRMMVPCLGLRFAVRVPLFK